MAIGTDEATEGAATAENRSAASGTNGVRKRVSLAVFIGVLVIGAAAGLWYYISTMGIESTDDAFIEADVYRIAPMVEGRLMAVVVEDNQLVAEGDVLARIDPADIQARLDQARAELALARAQFAAAEVQVGIVEASTAAALDQAKADLRAAEAVLHQEQAALQAAEAEASRAAADLARYSGLSERAVSPQRLDAVRAAATTADAEVRAAEKRVVSA